MELSKALRIAQSASGGEAVAPHVAGRLAASANGDSRVLTESVRMLTSEQLRGDAVLPDPIPTPASAVATFLGHISAAQRRLLLFFALDPAAAVPEVLDAAGVDVDLLLTDGLSELVSFEKGRMSFLSEVLRAQLVYDASDIDRHSALDALARIAQRSGKRAKAVAHRFAAHPEERRILAGPLLRYAEELLADGHAAAAYRTALASAQAAGPPNAWWTAAVAAFWAGAFSDAHRAARMAQSTVGSRSDGMLELQDTIALLRSGPSGVIYSAEEAAQIFGTLHSLARSQADLMLMAQLRRIYLAAYHDTEQADAMHARTLLGDTGTNGLSPHAQAHLTMSTLTALILDGAVESAAALLAHAAERWPLIHPAGGLVIGYARKCVGHGGIDDTLVNAFASIGPSTPLAYDEHRTAGLLPGRPTERAAAAVLLKARPSAVADPNSSPPPRAPLSARQHDVLDLILHGLTNKEIAERLAISPRTIEVHVTQILRKYAVSSRVALVALHRKQHLDRSAVPVEQTSTPEMSADGTKSTVVR